MLLSFVVKAGLKIHLNGSVVEEWSPLINPGKPISPFIEQITGITTEMVSEAPRFSDIATRSQTIISLSICLWFLRDQQHFYFRYPMTFANSQSKHGASLSLSSSDLSM